MSIFKTAFLAVAAFIDPEPISKAMLTTALISAATVIATRAANDTYDSFKKKREG